jgi:hypothetical protein
VIGAARPIVRVFPHVTACADDAAGRATADATIASAASPANDAISETLLNIQFPPLGVPG